MYPKKHKIELRAKLDESKIVKNCWKREISSEIGEISSFKKLLWTNHANEKAENSLNGNIFWWNFVSENVDWLYLLILEI